MAVGRFRSRRIQLFLNLFNPGKESKILDLGGTSETWKETGLNRNVTLLNLTKPKKRDLDEGFQCIQADAVNLEVIPNRSYDIVFSNSVIEHLGGGGEKKSLQMKSVVWENRSGFKHQIDIFRLSRT